MSQGAAPPGGGASPPGAFPPNFYDPKPLANHSEVIHGVSISFMVICWMAVAARLAVRFIITKTPGWDDFFIVLSMLVVSAGGIAFCVATDFGMGQHIYLIPPEKLESLLICHYLATACYNTSTALIKISILFQYLRVFESGTVTRRFTQGLLVLVSGWGFAFSFMAWFACLPHPSNLWKLEKHREGCYGGASTNPATVVAFINAHGGANLGFDLLVLLLAFRCVLGTNISGVRLPTKLALLSMGTVSCCFAIWRLAEVVQSQGGQGGDDISWSLPEPTLLSFCEIFMATLVASIPFFWPIITEQLGKIFVRYEFNVSVESRYYQTDDGADDVELAPTKSGKSATTVDEVRLNPKRLDDKQSSHYQDDFVQHMVDPFGQEFRTEAAVQSQPTRLKKKASFA